MKKISLVVLALATALATSPAAKADSFNFTVNGSAYTTGTANGHSVGGGPSISGNGVLAGTNTLQDLRDQADNVLKAVDKYVPERQRDPDFDTQIDQLRDFVKRVDAGEKITP